MPTSDSVVPTNSTSLRSTMLSKKLKISYDDQLSVSRDLFDLSRKRVDSLKKKYYKRFRKLEKPVDGSWITSGKLGSRDAVLVFRTNILKVGGKHPSSTETNLSELNNPVEKKSLETIGEPSNSKCSSTESVHAKSHALRRNDGHGSESSFTGTDDSDTSKSTGNLTTKSSRQTYVTVQRSFHGLPKSPKRSKELLTLSSSENSMSSGTDDPQDDEEKPSENVPVVERISITDCDVDTKIEPASNEFEEDIEASGDCEDDEDLLNIAADGPYSDDMPAVKLKISYKFNQTETKLLRKIFIRHGLSEVEDDEHFNILWTGVHLKPDILRNMAPYQRVNHFPRSYELTRKDRLYKNIERMQHLRGIKHFDFVPQSFLLPVEYRELVCTHNKYRGPWIVKPAASSRGRGIFIVNSPDQIPQDEQVLVSKYVADPLCIDGHKCDLRVYVLVTSFDPLIIYMYKEGLVRLATVKYERDADNLWNPCMHLCNYSINKYHSDYIKSSDAHQEDVGHKWTLSALLRHLKSQGCNTQQLMLNIEDVIIKSILACAQSVISACRMFVPNGNNCFELYGFDILIDDTLKPWLLEVNLSPSMGVDSPLDSKVKVNMMTDLLTCVGIPACTKSMREHYDNKWTRFRNTNYSRRTNSAEPASSHRAHANVNNNNSNSNNPNNASRRSSYQVPSTTTATLTIEENRIIRNARLQNVRRGGFVRIFPTEDCMQRYSSFLDPITGIPMSTPQAHGHVSPYSMILPHNYNQILFNHLYGSEAPAYYFREEQNSESERMQEYESALEPGSPVVFLKKRNEPKCVEQCKRLRKQILKMIDKGSELTQLQARQTFALYLDAILGRLSQDPKDSHEKLIIRFLNRVGGTMKPPVFVRNTQNCRVISKARTAMIAKLLGDFLEQYTRDTEAYVDAFDHFGMIPSSLYSEFLSQAQEADLEAVLTLHTNVNGTMPYLYNRCGLSVPPTPPIPSGLHGFLRALPAMVVSGSGARDFNKYDGYYKNYEKELAASSKFDRLPDINAPNGKKYTSMRR